MVSHLPQSLEASGIRFVRIVWCDNANLIRAKAVHTGALALYLEHGVSIAAGQQAMSALYDAVVPDSGLGPVGEVWLVPDWTTLTPLPYSPGQARVLGDMVRDGKPWPLCPRGFLRRQIAEAARVGLEVLAAFENEFYLLRPGDGPLPADSTPFAATASMDQNRAVIGAIAEALLAQGIPVEQYYPESGPGQQEITIRATHPLQAADRQVAFRETVRAVALAHGLKASFLPKIFPDAAGSGCHLHLSLWQGGENLLPKRNGRLGLSEQATAFIAGLLEHLPALMAITTPSPNSYRRIRPHVWSGAFRCWGLDNREAAVRVPSSPTGPGPTHFEFKIVDATANPYLALGAVLAAG
ncbi:MAG TPA: glutamine synthetase family protein, partial [Gemmataceae bacterium]|nr:glutamine synthetase family protein [Gemmataceae bacterium]